jgi:branched-chain amino acid transport system substrate-binding protein
MIEGFAAAALYGTAWLSVVSWAVTPWLRPPWPRLVWTAGSLVNLAHVCLAMQLAHGWDQERAYRAIARQTYEETGLDWGGGLYINYLFSTIWLADAAVWWLWPRRYSARPRWLQRLFQGVFLFMFFNATVVFGKSPIRFLGAVLCPLGAIGWFRLRPSNVHHMQATLLLILLAVLPGCGPAPAPAPIYLGHVAAMNGPARSAGAQETLGIRLAIEELQRAGEGNVGDRPIHVKHAEAGEEGTMEAQAVRLAAVGRVAALYGGQTPEEVTLLERSRVPVLTPLGWRPRGASELVFSTGVTPSARGQKLARFAVLDQDVQSIVLFVDQRQEEARRLADAFEQEFPRACKDKHAKDKHGKENSGKAERVAFGVDADFGELARAVEPTKVQAALFAGSASDYESWRQALKDRKVLLFFGGERPAATDLGDAFFVSAFAIDKETSKTVAFAERFRGAFKQEPDVHAALAYDGVRLLIDALRRAYLHRAEALVDELRKTKDFPGLTGPLTFGPDQQMRRPVYICRMSGNQPVPVKRYD